MLRELWGECLLTAGAAALACGLQVRAAYSSGHPALGVGAGNTPAVIDETADVQVRGWGFWEGLD